MSEPVRIEVIQPGPVRVNAALMHRQADGIACIYVDMHSKHVEEPMIGGGDGEPPTLYFIAGDHALHLDEDYPRDAMTVIQFPDYVGWDVFATSGPARYTLGVVLVKKEPSK